MINENGESNVDPQDQGVYRGERKRIPRGVYVRSRRGKTDAKEIYIGVGFPIVREKVNKEEKSRSQFTWDVILYQARGNKLTNGCKAPPARYDIGAAGVPPDRRCCDSTI